jgi:CheY-like chemotaxis protein
MRIFPMTIARCSNGKTITAAHAMKGDRGPCLEAEMDDYISKPIEPQELVKKIETWVDIDKGGPG